MPQLTSFDVYAKHKPGSVLRTTKVSDVCSGMNPCYYLKDDDGFKISSSVASLILDSGRFELDPSFKPARFFLHPWQRNAFEFLKSSINTVEKTLGKAKFSQSGAIKKLSSAVPGEMKKFIWNPHRSAHVAQNSIDSRIRKLGPFESVDSHASPKPFELDYSIKDIDEYLERSAKVLTKTINDIEEAFPQKKHFILMGGKDSQLIALIPKIEPHNWFVFSAEPNYSLITDWIAQNDIALTEIIRHDGRNEESLNDMKRKIVCGDLYTNIIHIRYLPTLEKLVHEHDGECIFWLGSMSRRMSLFDASYRTSKQQVNGEDFFNSHLNTFPGWQGNIHQVYSNYLKCPFFSPYYMKEPWFELYRHLDPAILVAGKDYRPRLADLLAGKSVTWPSDNPGPKPYQYWNFWFNSYRYYVSYIQKSLQR